MMKKILVSSVVAGMLCVANAQTYAVVDGQKITDQDMSFFKQMVPGFDFARLNKDQKMEVINQLIERKLALLAAKKDNIQKNKEYKEALTSISNNLAIDFWVKAQREKFAQKAKVTEAEAKQFYDANQNRFIEQEADIRMIVVKTKEEAEAIIKDLKDKKGNALKEAFIKAANEKSIDPNVKQKQDGGNLGKIDRNQMLPQFVEAVFDLTPKSITLTPIQTQAGYHIIFLEDKTTPKTISFSEAKAGIENGLQNERINQMLVEEMKKMREKAKVKIEEIK
ncbi:hypothetical protein BBW65_01290 [Helicobacter enhydrae]|uniref:PpiC domain-containing protein n=1 Tax=Helicobacter enhydrae TaxID=222136 RepID=A0A1B1U437_9HELI|nr:peptidyl-prolyl cis-trans isomerase [Helicobacter enhydrae]ANV97523.1 hypothetical protein BBW65_01290 [Helicobacter enhydrae]